MNRNHVIYYVSQIRKKAGAFIESRLEREGLKELGSSHGTILSALYAENEPLTMTDIARRILRNKSTTSQLVDKLEKGGYIEKSRCPEDGRVAYVTLTQKGRDIQPVFNSISKELIEKAYEHFSAEESEELLRLLKKLHANFKTEK